jgi:hypothetical protein
MQPVVRGHTADANVPAAPAERIRSGQPSGAWASSSAIRIARGSFDEAVCQREPGTARRG